MVSSKLSVSATGIILVVSTPGLSAEVDWWLLPPLSSEWTHLLYEVELVESQLLSNRGPPLAGKLALTGLNDVSIGGSFAIESPNSTATH